MRRGKGEGSVELTSVSDRRSAIDPERTYAHKGLRRNRGASLGPRVAPHRRAMARHLRPCRVGEDSLARAELRIRRRAREDQAAVVTTRTREASEIDREATGCSRLRPDALVRRCA